MKRKLIWTVANMCRLLISAIFIFSGIVKLIDPTGTVYKVTDYMLAIFGANWLPWVATLMLAVLLGLVEFCLGIYILFGIRRRWTTRIAVALMAFYTPLTLWLAITDAVPDCGCFGDALKLTNWQTFWKNTVLLALCVMSLRMRKHYTRFISEQMQWLVSLYSIAYGLFLAALCIYALPVIDFRPYHIGQHIPTAMEWPVDADGVPLADATPEIIDFDFAEVDEVLADTGYTFLLVAPALEVADDGNLDCINAISDYATRYGYRFLCLTSSSEPAITRWQDLTGAEYPFSFADAQMLMTMVRSNPGLVLIHNGTIINKWSSDTMPGEEALSAPLHTLDIGHLHPSSYRRMLLSLLLWYLVPLLLLTFVDRLVAGTKWYKQRKNRALQEQAEADEELSVEGGEEQPAEDGAELLADGGEVQDTLN